MTTIYLIIKIENNQEMPLLAYYDISEAQNFVNEMNEKEKNSNIKYRMHYTNLI